MVSMLYDISKEKSWSETSEPIQEEEDTLEKIDQEITRKRLKL